MNPVLMWSLAVFGIALSVYVISIFLSPDNVGLSSVKALVRTKFPKAPQLSTQQLENWMQEKNSKPILIHPRRKRWKKFHRQKEWSLIVLLAIDLLNSFLD